MDPEISLDIHIKNKSLSVGYILGVYRAQSDSYDILGKIYPDSIYVANKTLQDLIVYEGACAKTCLPGSYRSFDSSVSGLDCCWTCYPCPTGRGDATIL